MLYICTRLRKCLVDIFTSTALRQLAGAAVCFQLKVMCLGKTIANIAIKWFFINALHYAVKMQPSIIRFQAYSHEKYYIESCPEHDCLTFFMQHKKKCKPLHFEREHFSDFIVLDWKMFKPMYLLRMYHLYTALH